MGERSNPMEIENYVAGIYMNIRIGNQGTRLTLRKVSLSSFVTERE